MSDNSLDSILVNKLPEWFAPYERIPGPMVYVLLTDEEHLEVTPDQVFAALDRLVESQTLGLRWYPYHRSRPFDQEYIMEPPAKASSGTVV